MNFLSDAVELEMVRVESHEDRRESAGCRVQIEHPTKFASGCIIGVLIFVAFHQNSSVWEVVEEIRSTAPARGIVHGLVVCGRDETVGAEGFENPAFPDFSTAARLWVASGAIIVIVNDGITAFRQAPFVHDVRPAR